MLENLEQALEESSEIPISEITDGSFYLCLVGHSNHESVEVLQATVHKNGYVCFYGVGYEPEFDCETVTPVLELISGSFMSEENEVIRNLKKRIEV